MTNPICLTGLGVLNVLWSLNLTKTLVFILFFSLLILTTLYFTQDNDLKIIRIIDGDTLVVYSEEFNSDKTIRLSLINTPEKNESGYAQAKDRLAELCPVGSTLKYIDDKGQGSSFGREIGLVFCNSEKSANQIMLEQGYAELLPKYVEKSAFGSESWVINAEI